MSGKLFIKESGDEMGYCPKCGAKVHDDEIFCVSCGTKLPADRQSRFQSNRFSIKTWLFPTLALMLIGLIFSGIHWLHQQRSHQATDLFEEAADAFYEDDYEESLTLTEKALTVYPTFQAAEDLNKLLTLYLENIHLDDSLSYQAQLEQLHNLQISLDDYKGEAIDRLVMNIKHMQEQLQLEQIDTRLSNDLSIQDLQALVWEIEAIHSTDALLLKQQLRERLSSSIASLANSYLADNKFSDATELVENGLYYLPDDQRLLSLKETINLAQNQFVTALEERMEKAYQSYEEEVAFNESKAVNISDVALSETTSGQLKVKGTVKSEATVPIYHIEVTFELLNHDNDVIDTRTTFVYPDVLYPFDEGQLDYIFLDKQFNDEATDVKIASISWLLNEEEPS
ncbi:MULTISPECIES: zinc ribbon domain-containing protein [Halolactibacillus]|uniref:Zinc-ribbon domain-containing protein n=2 Tax=Halolactibacillus miurensis TaxID=306541 RepID=A0A1I6R580_9BACI|nr:MULTISPECIES: zinc-ribbon domain-containing protein [Halolactibacillus]SFS59750.1 zinc-ribbon domain-containing protein [Halolactibacillus miurensis]